MSEFNKIIELINISRGFEKIDQSKVFNYSLKELKDTIIDCIKGTLVDKSTKGVQDYLYYVQKGILFDEGLKTLDINILLKIDSLLNWLSEQMHMLDTNGAIDYSTFISKDQNISRYSSFLEILLELEKYFNLAENSLLPLMRLLKKQKAKIDNIGKKCVLWKLFVIIDLACNRGYIYNAEYSECSDRKVKDDFIRDLICKEILVDSKMVLSKNISDSVRQSRIKYTMTKEESPNYKKEISNYNEFSIKIESIFDKWTFR